MNKYFTPEMYSDHPQEIKTERKYMSRFFGFFLLTYVISSVFVYACCFTLGILSSAFNMPFLMSDTVINAVSSLNTPILFVLLNIYVRKINKSRHPIMGKMLPHTFLAYVAVCLFLMMSGSMLGNTISGLVNLITGSDSVNVVEQFINETSMLETFIYAVVMAPIFEELVFRKLIVDSFAKYGTAFCIFLSGITFGLFHGNFYQFFYAFSVGAIFAFIYCTYGKIWHTILLHAILNFFGSIFPMLMGLTGAISDQVSVGLLVYLFSELFAVIVGGILFFKNFRNSKYYFVSGVLLRPYRVLFKSAWFIVFLILSAVLFVISFFAF